MLLVSLTLVLLGAQPEGKQAQPGNVRVTNETYRPVKFNVEWWVDSQGQRVRKPLTWTVAPNQTLPLAFADRKPFSASTVRYQVEGRDKSIAFHASSASFFDIRIKEVNYSVPKDFPESAPVLVVNNSGYNLRLATSWWLDESGKRHDAEMHFDFRPGESKLLFFDISHKRPFVVRRVSFSLNNEYGSVTFQIDPHIDGVKTEIGPLICYEIFHVYLKDGESVSPERRPVLDRIRQENDARILKQKFSRSADDFSEILSQLATYYSEHK